MKYLVKSDNCLIELESKEGKYYKVIEEYLKSTATMLSAVDEQRDWVDFSKLMQESLKILLEKYKGAKQ